VAIGQKRANLTPKLNGPHATTEDNLVRWLVRTTISRVTPFKLRSDQVFYWRERSRMGEEIAIVESSAGHMSHHFCTFHT
jgi:hypothetical protein